MENNTTRVSAALIAASSMISPKKLDLTPKTTITEYTITPCKSGLS